jgi:pyruvate dehydrogenase E2 component (dihydrolipoamide acetyltransferase)
MARLLRMPEVAANTLEATLSEWLLAEDAAFSDGDSIATVETDKAAVDVPAEGHGVLVRTLVRPGTTVAVGAPMALIAAPGEQIADVDAVLAELGGASAPAGPGTDSATGVELDGQTAPEEVPGPLGEPAAESNGGRVLSSPLARRLVREHGLSLSDLTGTGPGGRIVREDVRRAVEARGSLPVPDAAAGPVVDFEPAYGSAVDADPAAGDEGAGAGPAFVPVPGPDADATTTPDGPAPAAVTPAVAAAQGSGAGAYEDVPHSRMRRAIALRLAESNREAPDFAIRGSARVDDLLALRAQLNAGGGPKISVNDLVVAAVARTHARLPEMNVVWTPDAVRRFRAVDVGVAVATDRGLVTPVLRGAENLTVSAIARVTADFAERARAGTLRPDELDGGSITVSNLGGYGTEDFTAVLNPPQAAILAVGAARKEAVVTGDELGIATVLRVTLTVDHRPVDGALAARWMAAFRELLEQPLRILA